MGVHAAWTCRGANEEGLAWPQCAQPTADLRVVCEMRDGHRTAHTHCIHSQSPHTHPLDELGPWLASSLSPSLHASHRCIHVVCELVQWHHTLKAITMKTRAGSRCPSAGDGKADERITQGRCSCSRKGHSIPSRPADANPRTRPSSAAAMVRPPKIGEEKGSFYA
jgi:hypothetical protein